MRRLLLLLSIVFIFFLPSAVHAQDDLKFEEVRVDIWPEYDKSSVLVVYHLILPEDAVLPQDISFRIPAQSEINAVAVVGEDGNLFKTPYAEQIMGDENELTFAATTHEVQIEYYDSLSIQDSRRQYRYLWPGNYGVDSFSIIFQQPVDSTDLEFSSSMEFLGVDNENLSYYQMGVVSLTAGQTYDFSFEYLKTTDRLSVSGMQVQPVEPLSGSGSGESSSIDAYIKAERILRIVLIIMMAASVIILAWAIIVYVRRKNKTVSVRALHKTSSGPEDRSSEGPYCPQCGRRCHVGDQFCRVCGTRLKRGV